MKRLPIALVLIFTITGCSNIYSVKPSPEITMLEQGLAQLESENKVRFAEFRNRLEEVRTAYENGELTKAEYLLLKNNILKELGEYQQSNIQRANMLKQEADNSIDKNYDRKLMYLYNM